MIKSTKFLFTIALTLVMSTTMSAQECVRFTALDPVTDVIAITNYGTETVDYSMHRFCSLFSYTNAGIAAGALVVSGDISAIPPGGSVGLIWPLDDNAADLSIYLPTGSFGDGNNMVDFVQYGAAGLGRESEAASVGLWTAGDFVDNNGATLFSIIDCSSNGVGNWETVGVEEFDQLNTSIYPNPVMDEVTIELNEDFTENLTIEVFNSIGALVEKRVIQNPSDLIKLDATSWSSGTFTIMIRTDEKSAVKNLIKL